MVKKIVETEEDFPDCAACGKGIFEGENFYDISIRLSKMTVDNRGGGCGRSTGNSSNPLRICENCFSNDGMEPIVKLRIIQELEKQKRELEPKPRRKS
uniref:Uncharacterized protein n=1 Tax=viral metagenome TaxID=1070528 RepID=A0A6M3X520_9ZZZZ